MQFWHLNSQKGEEWSNIWSYFFKFAKEAPKLQQKMFSEKKQSMISDVLWFNDVCRTSAKVKAAQRKNNNLHQICGDQQRNKPLDVLGARSRNRTVSGFVTFYSVSLRRQCLLSVSKDKARSNSALLDKIPLLHLDCMHHGGLCHKSSTRPSLTKPGWLFFCGPELSSLGTQSVECGNN